MPLTAKGREILAGMEKEYGAKKGESVFYASKNKGTIGGVDSVGTPERSAANPQLDQVVDKIIKWDAAHSAQPSSAERTTQPRHDSKFGKLVGKLEKSGKSKEYATKVAAKVGREKYGAKSMAKKSAAARKHKKS